jgi:hypothetical protein
VNIALADVESVTSGLGLTVLDANVLGLEETDAVADSVPKKVNVDCTDEEPVRETGEALNLPLGDASDDGDSALLRVNVCELRDEASEDEEGEYEGSTVLDC